MADAKLDDLLQAYGIARATQWTSGGPFDEMESAREALVAHVREREVELMGLALFGRSWPPTIPDPVAYWRSGDVADAETYRDRARALRDAYDQAGEVA